MAFGQTAAAAPETEPSPSQASPLPASPALVDSAPSPTVAESPSTASPALAAPQVATAPQARPTPRAGAPRQRGEPLAPDQEEDDERREREAREAADLARSRGAVRLRLGFHANGGVLLGTTLGGGGLSVRIGAQLTPLVAVYYQPSLYVFYGGGSKVGPIDPSMVTSIQNALLVSLTVHDAIELAAGPSSDIVGYGGVVAVGAPSQPVGLNPAAGRYVGIETRLAWHVAVSKSKSWRRTSFTIGVNPHVSFVLGATLVALTGGVGADWY